MIGLFPATTMPDADWWRNLWPDPGKVLSDMGVRPGVVAVDLCCGDGLFTAPLAGIAKRVYAIDIDPVMLDRARARIAEAHAANCEFVLADAMSIDAAVPESAEYVFLANTFHGVPDQLGLAHAVAASLKPKGQFGIINWQRRRREETVVLGQPRGPKTEMRMDPDDVAAIVRPAGLSLHCAVDLPPYHYGIVLRRGERDERRSTS